MGSAVQSFIASVAQFYSSLVIPAAIVVGLELFWHKEPTPLATRLRGAVFLILSMFVLASSTLLFNPVWDRLGIKPLFPFAALHGDSPLALIGLGVLAFVISEFITYWLHRFQHAFLWRFHKVHHSIRELHALSGYHWVFDSLFRIPLVIIPVGVLFGPMPHLTPVLAFIVAVQGYYIHSSAGLSLGPLRAVIIDNRFHRLHHSLEPQHWDKNFGNVLAIWDILFGTAVWPKKDEWPAVGLHDTPEPQDLLTYVALPFTRAHERPSDLPLPETSSD